MHRQRELSSHLNRARRKQDRLQLQLWSHRSTSFHKSILHTIHYILRKNRISSSIRQLPKQRQDSTQTHLLIIPPPLRMAHWIRQLLRVSWKQVWQRQKHLDSRRITLLIIIVTRLQVVVLLSYSISWHNGASIPNQSSPYPQFQVQAGTQTSFNSNSNSKSQLLQVWRNSSCHPLNPRVKLNNASMSRSLISEKKRKNISLVKPLSFILTPFSTIRSTIIFVYIVILSIFQPGFITPTHLPTHSHKE